MTGQRVHVRCSDGRGLFGIESELFIHKLGAKYFPGEACTRVRVCENGEFRRQADQGTKRHRGSNPFCLRSE